MRQRGGGGLGMVGRVEGRGLGRVEGWRVRGVEGREVRGVR